MRSLRPWVLTAGVLCAGCAKPPAASSMSEAPAPPAPPGVATDAPMAGAHVCPDGTQEMIEHQTDTETLRSCVVPGREYRNTPFRHGPYELSGAGGRVRMRGQWRDNQSDGVWRWWHPNGKLRRETAYQNGVPLSDASWDDAGRPIDRRDANGWTSWYPNGNKQMESKATADGGTEVTSWFENGTTAKQERTRNGQREGTITEWFENGTKKEEVDYRAGKMVGWKGWSSNGREITGSSCVEDADCVGAIKPGECYACLPPYQAITRWQEADRRMHPPAAPKGCDPGPFPCAMLPSPPPAACRTGGCALTGP